MLATQELKMKQYIRSWILICSEFLIVSCPGVRAQSTPTLNRSPSTTRRANRHACNGIRYETLRLLSRRQSSRQIVGTRRDRRRFLLGRELRERFRPKWQNRVGPTPQLFRGERSSHQRNGGQGLDALHHFREQIPSQP